MKRSREFEIAYLGLKGGEHEFDYTLDNRFLEDMEYDGEEIKNLDCKVHVTFIKNTNLFQLKFDFDGTAVMSCDRCGDDMPLEIWDEFKLIIKLSFDGQEGQEMEEDDDVVFLPKSETVIDLSKWLYEYLLLSLPYHRIHPEDEKGNSTCNPEALKLLEKYRSDEAESQRDKNWKGLEQFKKNDNLN